MLTLIIFFTDKKDFIIRSDILTSVIYAEAVRDLIWEEMWKNVIYTELTVLTINEIWEETVSLRKVNIVINKWIFKFKLNINEFLNKLKVRLVTKDFS